MTDAATGSGTAGGVHNSTFQGPTAMQVGPFSTQHVQFVYQWKPAYRIEDFPGDARPVRARVLAEQPSRLLRAAHQVVPFTGRHHDLGELARWRDAPAEKLAVRLVHGPGGQGKTRLAAHFASMSREAGWTVWQAAVNETGADSMGTSEPPEAGNGILLVVDYAERWPTPDLRKLLQEPLWHRTGQPVRILLLARPAGVWWESLDTWIADTLDIPAEAHPLPPLADHPHARADLFHQARDRFADHLGLPADRADRIATPPDLDTDEDYAQVLTIHIAALAAVDADLHHESAPADPARASAYLLKRERAHWNALHQRPSQPLTTTPEAMGRTVLTATLTRPLARPHGWTALQHVGLADSTAAANTLLDDHRYCYPAPAHAVTVLEPLYPDRLGEDFLGLSTPAGPDDTRHPVPGAVTDDWADQAAHRLLATADPSAPAPWTRDALTVLIETARRWPHVATGQLYPLLRNRPELALHAGGTALAALAGLDNLDLTVLEAIEPHLPADRYTDLDVGIAAITARLAHHRLATTDDPATRAGIHGTLAIRQYYAGLRDEALTSGQHAVGVWRDLTRTDPTHEPELAAALVNLGAWLSGVGRRDEALTATEEAVDVYRRLAAGGSAANEPNLAAALSNLGAWLSGVGRRDEALTATEEAVDVYRRLAAGEPDTYEADLAASLSNLGNRLSGVGRRAEALTATEEAVAIRRRLTAGDPAAHEPDLATALSNLGNRLSGVGRQAEALTAELEAVEIRRRLVAGNPAAYEPDLARSLSNLGNRLSGVGRWAEALIAVEEAVEIGRRLVAGNPAAYEPDLARSLSNLGNRLSGVGRWAEALIAVEEAVEIGRRLVAGNPAAHEPDLALSLTAWAWVRHEAQQNLSRALRATGEAVEIYRRLVTAVPERFLSPLCNALRLQAGLLISLGHRREARAIHVWLAANEPQTDSQE